MISDTTLVISASFWMIFIWAGSHKWWDDASLFDSCTSRTATRVVSAHIFIAGVIPFSNFIKSKPLSYHGHSGTFFVNYFDGLGRWHKIGLGLTPALVALFGYSHSLIMPITEIYVNLIAILTLWTFCRPALVGSPLYPFCHPGGTKLSAPSHWRVCKVHICQMTGFCPCNSLVCEVAKICPKSH